MAKANLIEPFPSHIDRDQFGHWLSGFAAGESTFLISAPKTRFGRPLPRAQFRIVLRMDDFHVLKLIQSYFACGVFTLSENARCKIPNAKPICIYNVTKINDLANIIVPHFRMFHLRAKKADDFRVWSEAVTLLSLVHPRTHKIIRDSRNRAIGTTTKWTDPEIEQFKTFISDLKTQRIYGPVAS